MSASFRTSSLGSLVSPQRHDHHLDDSGSSKCKSTLAKKLLDGNRKEVFFTIDEKLEPTEDSPCAAKNSYSEVYDEVQEEDEVSFSASFHLNTNNQKHVDVIYVENEDAKIDAKIDSKNNECDVDDRRDEEIATLHNKNMLLSQQLE